ncbi:MAG: pyridoxamine 5'-phosphate oxidase family protein [Candidatus Thorarchaeota archaeon]|jgi:general stress protein 26
MSDEEELRKVCIRLLNEAWPVYLTTIDGDGFPQTRAMFNLRNGEKFPKLTAFFSEQEDVFFVIFSTNTSSTKIENVNANPKSSAYYCLPGESRGAMIGGTLEIVTDDVIKQTIWHDGWERYYPSGYNDPDHTVLRFHGRIARGWNQSRTFRIEIGDRT